MYTPATQPSSKPVVVSSGKKTTAPAELTTKPKAPAATVNNRQDKNLDVKRQAIIATAKKYIGCKYKSACVGPKKFDCSGYTYFIFKQYGVSLSRSATYQYEQGTAIKDMRKLKPGDLVFWRGRNAKNPRVGHVGIVIEGDPKTGQFTFIHAALTGVQINRSEESYYKLRFVGARRVLE